MKNEKLCRTVRQLAVTPSEDLSPFQREQLQEHLAVCVDCTNRQKNYEALRMRIHAATALEPVVDLTPQWSQMRRAMIQQQKRMQRGGSGRTAIYTIAKWAWPVTTWIWTTIIIAFLVQFVPNLFTLPDATISMKTTWAAVVIGWLVTHNNILIQEMLRVIAIGLAFLLVAIPPLAFGLKQALRNVEQDRQHNGIDKLLDVLQQDTISAQLEQI